jgi:hypothetical protein
LAEERKKEEEETEQTQYGEVQDVLFLFEYILIL